MMRVVISLFLLFSFSGAFGQTVTPNSFGQNFKLPLTNPQPKVFGCFNRMWNAEQGTGDVSWAAIETAQGVYNWTTFDATLAHYAALGCDIIYTFGDVPAWASSGGQPYDPPSNFQYLYDFQTAVINRAAGRIKYYNIWNEADLSTIWWGGTQAQMLTIAQETYSLVHSLAPNSLVTTPTSASSGGFYWMQTYLAAGGGAYADVMDIHCYPFRSPSYGSTPPVSTPEASWNTTHIYSAMYALNVQSAKPWICNEGGWAQESISELTTLQEQAYAAIWQILLASGGINRFSWYQYDDTTWGPLTDGATWLNPPGVAFRAAQSWLSGATFSSPAARVANINQVRNSAMSGAVAGTPGTAPTDMSVYNPDSAKGISTQIVGTGTESGIAYVDFRVFGTATTGASGFVQFSFESGEQIAAALGQQWTGCVYAKLEAGSAAANSVVLEINENSSAGAYLDNILYDYFNPIGAALNLDQECFAAPTVSASVAYVVPNITVTYSVGTAIDVTLRLGYPTMDTGSQWAATITKPGGYQAMIRWDAAGGPTSYTASGTYTYQRWLDGSSRPIVGNQVTLTNLPVLLENTQFSWWSP